MLGRLISACLKVVGYTFAFALEMCWHLAHSRRDKAGETIGKWGRALTDALAGVFRS